MMSGESSLQPTYIPRSRGVDYGFVSTLDAEERRRGIREARHQAQIVETLRVMRNMMQEMGDMQVELLALREQQRRARQPGPDVRVLDH
ncbi:hypothetical protein Tco_0332255 [Tanacetum coccineum]